MDVGHYPSRQSALSSWLYLRTEMTFSWESSLMSDTSCFRQKLLLFVSSRILFLHLAFTINGKDFTFSKTSHWILHFRIFYHWIYTFVCVLSVTFFLSISKKKKKPHFFLSKSDLQVYGQSCIHLIFFKEIPSLILSSLPSLFLCLPLQENCSLTTSSFGFHPVFPHPF